MPLCSEVEIKFFISLLVFEEVVNISGQSGIRLAYHLVLTAEALLCPPTTAMLMFILC